MKHSKFKNNVFVCHNIVNEQMFTAKEHIYFPLFLRFSINFFHFFLRFWKLLNTHLIVKNISKMLPYDDTSLVNYISYLIWEFGGIGWTRSVVACDGSLIPKPLRKDGLKAKEKSGQVMRFRAKMISHRVSFLLKVIEIYLFVCLLIEIEGRWNKRILNFVLLGRWYNYGERNSNQK